MSDIAAIEARHSRVGVVQNRIGPDFGKHKCKCGVIDCEVMLMLARLREVEQKYDALRDANAADEQTFRKVKAERDRWRTSWENDVDTVARRCDEWKHELSNLALDRERERDAAEADAKALAEALRLSLERIESADEAMGHSYCDTQSGDYLDPCTCGYDEEIGDARAALAAHRERVK